MSIYLTRQQWRNHMKTIETKNLKKYRRSTAWISLFHYFEDAIISVRDGEIIEVDEDKYEQIRAHVMSEEFNLKNKEESESNA